MTAAGGEKLILWGQESLRAFRVHWMLIELGLDFEHRQIRSRTGETQTEEYTRINPKQKIPALQHGDFVLTESAAILNYLTATFPAPDDIFVPRTAAEHARLDEWCFFAMCELDAHPLYIIRRHYGLRDIYGPAPAVVLSARDYFVRQVNGVARRVAVAGTYLMGDKFSAADIVLASCLGWAINSKVPLPEEILAYQGRVTARPCFSKAVAAHYPDGWPTGNTPDWAALEAEAIA